jgi:hypothetical protein
VLLAIIFRTDNFPTEHSEDLPEYDSGTQSLSASTQLDGPVSLEVLRSDIRNRQTALSWLRLLGHLVSLEKLVPYGRLRIRAVQQQLSLMWHHTQTIIQ